MWPNVISGSFKTTTNTSINTTFHGGFNQPSKQPPQNPYAIAQWFKTTKKQMNLRCYALQWFSKTAPKCS